MFHKEKKICFYAFMYFFVFKTQRGVFFFYETVCFLISNFFFFLFFWGKIKFLGPRLCLGEMIEEDEQKRRVKLNFCSRKNYVGKKSNPKNSDSKHLYICVSSHLKT